MLPVRTLNLTVRERRGDNQQPVAGATIHIEVSVASEREPRQYTTTTNAAGQARIRDVAAGKLRVWGERSDGAPLDIVQVNDCPIPPGSLAWLRESDPCEITTSLDLLALPPPIMLNLRIADFDDDAGQDFRLRDTAEAAESETWYRLNDDELAYLRENGGNAAVVVHGFAVALGEPPHGLKPETTQLSPGVDWRERAGRDDYTRLAAADTRARAYIDPKHVENVFRSVSQDEFDRPDDHLAALINGQGAWSWQLGMEGNLNRAAGGQDMVDYSRYQRVVGVTWSGNRGQTNFLACEMAAQQTGRRLVPLLCQLADEGIAVNLITHSLGSRVVLTALNLIAQMREGPVVDQVFLWEPALTENAFATPDDFPDAQPPYRPAAYPDPMGHERFPDAPAAAGRIVVLHSKRDGVLGPAPDASEVDFNNDSDYRPEKLDETSRWDEDLAEMKDGIYPERYLFNARMAERYDADRFASRSYPDEATRWQHLWRQLATEATRSTPNAEQLAGRQPLPELNKLLPWAREFDFDDTTIEALTNRLFKLFQARPDLPLTEPDALGWGGPDRSDPQIDRLMTEGRIDVIDQTNQLATHSGFWFPDERLFERIVRAQVWERFMKEVGFGTYA
jgi:hypothetical protein